MSVYNVSEIQPRPVGSSEDQPEGPLEAAGPTWPLSALLSFRRGCGSPSSSRPPSLSRIRFCLVCSTAFLSHLWLSLAHESKILLLHLSEPWTPPWLQNKSVSTASIQRLLRVRLLTRLLLRLLTQLPFSLLSSGLLCFSFPTSPFTAPTQIFTWPKTRHPMKIIMTIISLHLITFT